MSSLLSPPPPFQRALITGASRGLGLALATALRAGGTTVILVSHSIEQIERMCSKVAWLSHGHLKMNGDTETVCNAYKAVQRGEA